MQQISLVLRWRKILLSALQTIKAHTAATYGTLTFISTAVNVSALQKTLCTVIFRVYSFDIITANGFNHTCFCDCELKIKKKIVVFCPLLEQNTNKRKSNLEG